MYQKQIRLSVGIIVIAGHISVFLFGFFILGILTEPFSQDTLQIILMASPVLAATAVAALKYVLREEVGDDKGERVRWSFAVVTLGIPICLVAVILLLFLLAYYRAENFSLGSLKIALGFVETFFAVFMSAISEQLFATPNMRGVRRVRSTSTSSL
jgi:hypothetical protein